MKLTYVAMNASFLFARLVGDIFQKENVFLIGKENYKIWRCCHETVCRKTRTNIRVPYSV